jgi:hypothetical protein
VHDSASQDLRATFSGVLLLIAPLFLWGWVLAPLWR